MKFGHAPFNAARHLGLSILSPGSNGREELRNYSPQSLDLPFGTQ